MARKRLKAQLEGLRVALEEAKVELVAYPNDNVIVALDFLGIDRRQQADRTEALAPLHL